jgi:hypothetical protein
VLTCGATSCGAASHGLVERDRVGQDETASRGASRKEPRGTERDHVWLYVRARFCLSRPKLAFFRVPFSPLSVTVLSLFTKLVSNLAKFLFLSFFNDCCLLALVFCPIW